MDNNGEDALDAAMPVGQTPSGGGAPAMPVQTPAGGGEDALDRAMTHAARQAAAAAEPAPKVDPVAIAHATKTIHGSDYTDDTPWSDVGAGFEKNAWGNLGDTAKGIGNGVVGLAKGAWNAATNPVETAKDIYHLAAPQTPEQQSHRDALLAATKAAGKGWLNHENQIWGTQGLLGGHTAGFKSAVANEPFSEVAMDASTFAGGAGLAAKGAGLAKTANALSLASKAVDPIYLSLKAAKVPLHAIVAPTRAAQSVMTGVPYSLLKESAQAGASPNPAIRAAFNGQHWGTDPATGPLKAISQAFEGERSRTMAALRADKRLSYANNPGAIPFGDVDAAFNSAKADLNRMPASYAPDVRKQFEQVENLINDWRADPNLRTMENMDRLRNEIGNLQHADKSRFTEHIGPIYGAIRKTMEKVDPKYTQTLENVSEAQREFNDMARTLSVNAFNGGTAMTPTLIARAIRSQMSANGRALMEQMAKRDKTIMPMLAGAATHEVIPHGMMAKLLGGVGSVGMGAALARPEFSLPLLASGATALTSASPRLAGLMNYGYGALDRAANSLPVKALYYAGKGSAQDAPAQPQQPKGRGDFAKILNIESNGGKQFDKDGSPLRSPAGAWGASQIMPATLKEAAEAAGEHPDIERLKHDEGYNLKLGNALFDKRVEEFGDPSAAAAAYNSNPATVHSAMKKARTTGGDWREYLPDETKGYVQNFEKQRTARASGGRATINHASEAASLIRKAESAKKTLGKSTEPLLNMPDEHIAKALSVANEAI